MRTGTDYSLVLQVRGRNASYEYGAEPRAHTKNRKRGSESKLRELSGNSIFQGPYPVIEICGGYGSDTRGKCPPRLSSCSKTCDMDSRNIFEAMTWAWRNPPRPTVLQKRHSSWSKVCELQGNNIFDAFTPPFPCPPQPPILHRPTSASKICELQGSKIFHGFTPPSQCPPPPPVLHRPTSASKINELQGHDIFEPFTNPFHYPPPPPLAPYEPEEMRLPPEKLHRTAGKYLSHFRIESPGCVDPPRPKTKCAWAKQKMLYGDMDVDRDSYPKPAVSDSKLRENAGHINLFGTPPAFSAPSTLIPQERHSDISYEGPKPNRADRAHQVRMQSLDSHNEVFLNYGPHCCREAAKRHCLSDSKARSDSGQLCGKLHRH